jgi:hydrogenase nickel incorporation protein HypA/HybF
MHELSLAQALVETIIGVLAENGAKQATRVVLAVGAMSGAVPDALEFAFEIASKNTPAEGAKLEIQSIPLKVRCVCGHEQFEMLPHCQKCEGRQLSVVAGRDLTLRSLEVR